MLAANRGAGALPIMSKAQKGKDWYSTPNEARERKNHMITLTPEEWEAWQDVKAATGAASVSEAIGAAGLAAAKREARKAAKKSAG